MCEMATYASLLDNINTPCHICNVDNYELVYMNKKAKQLFNVSENFYGKKCYEVFYNKISPCEFCNSKSLELNKNSVWKCFNETKATCFETESVLFQDNEILRRLDFLTELNEDGVCKPVKNSSEDIIVKAVKTLSADMETDVAVKSLLKIICDYYNSKNAFIFEFGSKKSLLDNNFEWSEGFCEDIKAKFITVLENNSFTINEKIANYSSSYIFNGGKSQDDNENSLLEYLKVDSLIVVPLTIKNNYPVGFICVIEPKISNPNLSLLESISFLMYNDLLKRKTFEKLNRMTNIDELTGVYNRNKYVEVLLELEKNPPDKLGIVYADVDGLRHINENYGQLHGDYFLMQNAILLEDVFGKKVFRLNSDEFIVIVSDSTKDEFDTQINILREKLQSDGNLAMTFGHIFKEDNFEDDERIFVTKLISYAEELMQIEKQRYYKLLSLNDISYKSGEIKALFNELHAGLFSVYIQPKVDLFSGKIISGEALVRKFDKDTHKIIPPDKFIPLYEKEKVIRHIDFFVLQTVCKMLRRWIDEGFEVKISVNLSRVTFIEQDAMREIVSICRKYCIPHSLIDLEVTESSDKADAMILKNNIIEAKRLGFSISLDDFGADYSNLLMLTDIEFEQVKFDKSLTYKICEDEKHKTVVEYAIKMCDDLHINETIAEGIETEEQRDLLIKLGCKCGQGYLFAKPMPIEKFYAIYRSQQVYN